MTSRASTLRKNHANAVSVGKPSIRTLFADHGPNSYWRKNLLNVMSVVRAFSLVNVSFDISDFHTGEKPYKCKVWKIL